MPRETHMLKPVLDCHHCGVKRFPKEPPGFCCCSEKVQLNAPVIPAQPMRLLFGSRVVNSLVNFRIVLSCMGKIGVGMASDHIMDAMMLFHTHSSSLAVSLDGIWISQRKVLPWRMSTWLVPHVRLVVVQKKKKHVCISSYTFHVYQTVILETPLILVFL